MNEAELKHQSELANARLEVAEELWWSMAIVSATAAHLKWSNWFLTLALFVVVYFIVVYRYRKYADKAEDEYYKVAYLGKYALPYEKEDA